MKRSVKGKKSQKGSSTVESSHKKQEESNPVEIIPFPERDVKTMASQHPLASFLYLLLISLGFHLWFPLKKRKKITFGWDLSHGCPLRNPIRCSAVVHIWNWEREWTLGIPSVLLEATNPWFFMLFLVAVALWVFSLLL